MKNPIKEEFKPFAVKLQKTEARQRLLGQPSETACFRSGQVILKPGESVGEHSTDNKEEIIVVLEGKAEIFSDKSPSISAEKDVVIYMPPHTMHNVKNIGAELLRYIYIVSPI